MRSTATAATAPAHQNALVQLDILKSSISNVHQRL